MEVRAQSHPNEEGDAHASVVGFTKTASASSARSPSARPSPTQRTPFSRQALHGAPLRRSQRRDEDGAYKVVVKATTWPSSRRTSSNPARGFGADFAEAEEGRRRLTSARKVTEAVITVPAYFNDANAGHQDAGKIAGSTSSASSTSPLLPRSPTLDKAKTK